MRGCRIRARASSFSNLIEAYLLACKAEGKSTRTTSWYLQGLRGFEDYLRSRRLPLVASAILPEILRGYITQLQATGVSFFTVRGYAQVVKGLFTWLEEEGYLAENPIRRAGMPKTPRYTVRPLEED